MLADAHETTLTRLIRAHSTRFVGAALVLLVVIGAVSPTGAAARDSITLNTPNSAVNNGSQPASGAAAASSVSDECGGDR